LSSLPLHLHPSPTRRSSDLAPQPRAAAHAVFIRDDLNVRLKLELELVGIAAADVEPVKIRQDAQILNGALHAAVPALLADLLARDRKSTRLNSSHLGISYAV